MPEGAAHDPSVFVAGLGRGWFGKSRRVVVLERYDGATWRRIGRYGTTRDATDALDELTATGEELDTLRVVEAGSLWSPILLVVATGALVLAAAIVLYVVLG